MTGNFPACRVNTRSNVAASPLALGESRCRNGWQLSTVSLLLAAGFHGGLTHRPHCLLMGYIRPFGPARNGFRALHPCTISALAMLRVCDISCGFTRYRFLLRRAGLLAPQRQQRSHSPQTLGSGHPGRTNSSCDYEAAGVASRPIPFFRILFAALISLSWVHPHTGQVQCLTLRSLTSLF